MGDALKKAFHGLRVHRSEHELFLDSQPIQPSELPISNEDEHDPVANLEVPVSNKQYTPYRPPQSSLTPASQRIIKVPQVGHVDPVPQHTDKHPVSYPARYFWQDYRPKAVPQESDIGLVEQTNDRGGTELVSVVSESHHSLQPRPELWETIEEQAQPNISDSMGDWPARLLQVSTWKSLEWQPGNVYGDRKEPSYAIISYTWGRWALHVDPTDTHPALNVSGITWKIPPIDPVLFTVPEFEHVLTTACARAETDFIWIDVACIDQTKDSQQKDKEIGRQAKIFHGATRAFIWLVGERSDRDEDVHNTLRYLERASIAADIACHPEVYGLDRGALDGSSMGSSAEGVPNKSSDHRWIGDAAKIVDDLISIPWFSSLWTLQEAFLRQEAEFLDREGKCSFSVTGEVFILDDILTHCNHFYRLCLPAINALTRSPVDTDSVLVLKAGLISTLERTGLHALADRDRTTLYACAIARQAHDPNDRIYGIMQVWNFQLGKSSPRASPNCTWTTEELALELGKKLIDKFPIESQLHVHRKSVPGRQSWRVSDTSAVPRYPIWVADSGHLEGLVDRQGSSLHCRRVNEILYGYFTGKSCSFTTLSRAWSLVTHRDHGPDKTKNRTNLFQIALDSTEILRGRLLQKRYSVQEAPDDKQQDLAVSISAFSEKVSRRISVLLLGIVKQQQDEASRTIAMGLIVMEAPDKAIGGWQKRLGFCLWDVPSDEYPRRHTDIAAIDVLSGDSSAWEVGECIFG